VAHRSNGGSPGSASPRRERRKGQCEVAIEARWRDRLLAGGASTDFARAYDDLHTEFLDQQAAKHTGVTSGGLYDCVNPRDAVEDRVRSVVVRAADELRARRILEVGTGDGLTARALAGLGASVCSVDVSCVALSEAKRARSALGLSLPYLALGDARSLPFPDAAFDLVVSENMVEHLSLGDMRRHLGEVRRALDAGGHYAVYTPNRRWSGRVSAGFHLHVYTLGELCSELRRAGFAPVWIEPRVAARMASLPRVRGLGLALAVGYEHFLGLLRVDLWPYALKARAIPGIMVLARSVGGSG